MTFKLAVAFVLWPAIATANPRPLPLSYPYDTLPEGKLEIDQHVDLVPVPVAREQPGGAIERVYSVRSVLQTELPYGITDKLEAAWSFVFAQHAAPGAPALAFDGVRQRLRARFAEMGDWPVDVGAFIELGEYHDRFEVAERLLLARRFGDLNAVANLWFEHAYDFQDRTTAHVYNPTAGVTYDLSSRVTVGAEYWTRGRLDESVRAPHYAGPTLHAQTDQVFATLGAYVRLDRLTQSATVDDPYGRLWFRALIGIEL